VRNVTNTLNKENAIQENITVTFLQIYFPLINLQKDQEKVIKLETMIKILKQENEELSQLKLGVKTTTPVQKKISLIDFINWKLGQ